MENEIVSRRRQIFILVAASVVVFIGLVWLIAAIRPWDLLGVEISTQTASQPVVRDCTRPITYWKAHPELYPPQVLIGGVAYEETELEALLSDDSQELAQQIKAQLVVAFLNDQAGADQDSIEATVFDAYGWLQQHPPGSQPTEADKALGRQLFDALETFNLGLADVAPCASGQVYTRTVRPTQTIALDMTLTPTEVSVSAASQTSTLTVLAATDTMVYIPPTVIPTRTSKPPVQNPTNTPRPPTAPPPPTDTPRPPDTPTNTPLPPSPTLPPPTPTLPAPTPTLP